MIKIKKSINQTAFSVSMESPIGAIFAVCSDLSVLSITLGKESKKSAEIMLARAGYQIHQSSNPLCIQLQNELNEYFSGKRIRFSVKTETQGTPFQEKIWRELLKVPFGKVVTYGQLAEQAGFPRAARAVGTAMAKNRALIVIPCHRVIAADGRLGGFGCGIEVKKALLRLEKAWHE
ncbi:MAG: methylated-DNA--[protein]-cysteine S-methyltransferase [Candidatus Omnitrophota bacterium]|jgi:methylated-DNA-[protein]-cysteine S-methyltransferase|nr:MAG: methylated-DNA--[protein]-cysteine S-methyltransferase [Candidatus Omnitrophota bacterium]